MAGENWASGIATLAGALDLSEMATRRWCNRKGFPKKTKKGYNVERCQKFIRDEKAKKLEGFTGPSGGLRRRKLEIEVETLDVKLQQLKGKVRTIDEIRNMFAEYAGRVDAVYTRWLDQLTAVTRDPKLLKDAKKLCNRVRQQLADEIRRMSEVADED